MYQAVIAIQPAVLPREVTSGNGSPVVIERTRG